MHRPEREVKDRPKWWVLATVGIGTFMSALNGSVVNAVLPVMRRGLARGLCDDPHQASAASRQMRPS